MTRGGAWPTPLASWVSPPSLAQASWVRLGTYSQEGLTTSKAGDCTNLVQVSDEA